MYSCFCPVCNIEYQIEEGSVEQNLTCWRCKHEFKAPEPIRSKAIEDLYRKEKEPHYRPPRERNEEGEIFGDQPAKRHLAFLKEYQKVLDAYYNTFHVIVVLVFVIFALLLVRHVIDLKANLDLNNLFLGTLLLGVFIYVVLPTLMLYLLLYWIWRMYISTSLRKRMQAIVKKHDLTDKEATRAVIENLTDYTVSRSTDISVPSVKPVWIRLIKHLYGKEYVLPYKGCDPALPLYRLVRYEDLCEEQSQAAEAIFKGFSSFQIRLSKGFYLAVAFGGLALIAIASVVIYMILFSHLPMNMASSIKELILTIVAFVIGYFVWCYRLAKKSQKLKRSDKLDEFCEKYQVTPALALRLVFSSLDFRGKTRHFIAIVESGWKAEEVYWYQKDVVAGFADNFRYDPE